MNNIVSIVLLIASAGLFFAYVDPTYTEIKALLVEKQSYDRALNNSKDLQSERDKLLTRLNEMPQVNQDKLEQLLPDNIDNVRLIIDVDEMAKTYGMRIRNFKTDTLETQDTIGRDNNPYGTLTLSFSTTASYNTFLAFIKDLEHSLRIMDIVSISFNPSETSQLYDFGVTVKTYWLK